MSDLISRQELKAQLDCVDRLRMITDERVIEVIPRWNVNKIIENLPSAERTGHWIYGGINIYGYQYYFCSECGYCSVIPGWNYCPDCGARMEGEEE